MSAEYAEKLFKILSRTTERIDLEKNTMELKAGEANYFVVMNVEMNHKKEILLSISLYQRPLGLR